MALAGGATAATISGTGSPLSAVPGGTSEGFDATPAGTYTSLTFGNVTISSVGADPFTVGTDYNGSYNTSGGQSIYNDFDYVPTAFRFDFASAVSAFAFNWGAADYSWTLSAFDALDNLLDALVIAPTYGSNAGEFFGIAAGGISYATLIGPGGDYVFIDNFASTTVAPVPVPAGLPLLLTAFGGLMVLRRFRRA